MRMSTGSATGKTRLAVVAAASALALVAAGAPAASAAPATMVKATSTCWLQVVNDWLHNGTVKGYYAIPCYTQAIQHLNAYPDIKQYSSAIDDIRRALQSATRQDRGSSGPTIGGGTDTNPQSGGGVSGGGGNNSSGGGGSAGSGHSKGLITRVANDIGPGDAQTIPLPLLVLGGLGLLLLLTAAATWFARRMQARRVPEPAPARAGSTVRPKP
jgi:hypothetical protein